MDRIQDTPWFDAFSDLAIAKNYKKGEVYCAQGETMSAVGLILNGRANAISYSINGHETWISEYCEGQFIGLRSLLTTGESNFEIRVSRKIKMLTLSHDHMLKLMREEPGLCEAVAIDLAERLNKSVTDLVDGNTLSVKGRICAELLRRALPIGIDPDRQIIRPSPVFVELARRLNSTRETVSRTVSELQKRGILIREPGALVVASPERLREAVEYI
jgi:CRP-like cAMP-binding protein